VPFPLTGTGIAHHTGPEDCWALEHHLQSPARPEGGQFPDSVKNVGSMISCAGGETTT
jgi:hypothetical protein